jgi:hypothetical protein
MASKKNKSTKSTPKKTPSKATTKPVRKGLDEAAKKARARKTPKDGPKSKAPKAPAQTKPANPLPSMAHAPPPPPPKASPPPKTERKGKTTRVTFENMDQVNYFAAKGVGDSFPLTAREILAREDEVKRLLESLKVHRSKLDGFTKDRDATKAKIDSTPDGQRLTGLKESVKNAETIIAALQKKLEVSTWEVSYGRTFDAQRELFDGIDIEIPEGPRMSAADRTMSLPLEEPAAPAAAQAPAPASAPEPLPPVEALDPRRGANAEASSREAPSTGTELAPYQDRTGVILEGEFEEAPSFADDVQGLLRQHGPLSIEALCTHLGWEERDSGNWQKLTEALRRVQAVKQDDGRWYLSEHLRALPPGPEAPVEPAAPSMLALGPAPSLRDQLFKVIDASPGVTREQMQARLGGDAEELGETLEQLVEQGAILEAEGGFVAVVRAPAPAPTPALAPAPAPTPAPALEAARLKILEAVAQEPQTQGALVGALCPPFEEELVREALRALVASEELELAEDETYRVSESPEPPPPAEASEGANPRSKKGKGKSPRSSAPSAPLAPAAQAASPEATPTPPPTSAPVPVPPRPAKGHPQRALREWVYARISQAGELSEEALRTEAKAYHREYVDGTVALLLACECLMERAVSPGAVMALELPEGQTVSEVILNQMAAALIEGGLDSTEVAKAFEIQHAIAWDLLEELQEQGRADRRGNAWSLVKAHRNQGAAE